MPTKTLFVILYTALVIAANYYITSGMITDTVLIAACTILIPVLLFRHERKYFVSLKNNWGSTAGISLLLGCIFAAVYTVEFYFHNVTIIIFGVPLATLYKAMARLFAFLFTLSFGINICVLVLYDFFRIKPSSTL